MVILKHDSISGAYETPTFGMPKVSWESPA